MSTRPRRPAPVKEPPATSPTLAGLYVALRAAVLGLLAIAVPVLVTWATAEGSGASAPEAVRSALQIWLLAHHASLELADGRVDILPMGLTAVLGFLLAAAAGRGIRAAGTDDVRAAATVVTVGSLGYALVVAVAAVGAAGNGVRPDPLSGFVGALALAVLSTGVAAARLSGLASTAPEWLSGWWRAVLAAAATAVTALLGGGAIVVLAATAAHLDRTAALADRLHAGLVGTVALLLVCLALLPNAVLAGTAYASGVGFTLGGATLVAPHDVHLGAVPALPLLGGLPERPVPWLGWLALAVPLVAGALAGRRLVVREPGDLPSWRGLAGRAAATGALAGLTLAVLAVLGSGAAGGHRLDHVGPVWWQVGPAVAVEVAVVAILAATASRRRVRQPLS